MSRWKIDGCENGYVVTYPREGMGGYSGKAIFKTWDKVIEFLRLADGNPLGCVYEGKEHAADMIQLDGETFK